MRFLLGFNLQYKGSSLAHGTQAVPPLTLNQYFRHLSTSWSNHSCQEIGIVYCISIWKGGKKNWKRTHGQNLREREGKLMSEESQLRVGHKKVLAWVLPPIPQPYPGQSANKSACQHRWSRTAHWGGWNKHRSLSVTMWELATNLNNKVPDVWNLMTPDVSTGRFGKAQTSLHIDLNARNAGSAGLVRVVTLRLAC